MVDFVRKHLLIVLLLFGLGVFSIALNVWSQIDPIGEIIGTPLFWILIFVIPMIFAVVRIEGKENDKK